MESLRIPGVCSLFSQKQPCSCMPAGFGFVWQIPLICIDLFHWRVASWVMFSSVWHVRDKTESHPVWLLNGGAGDQRWREKMHRPIKGHGNRIMCEEAGDSVISSHQSMMQTASDFTPCFSGRMRINCSCTECLRWWHRFISTKQNSVADTCAAKANYFFVSWSQWRLKDDLNNHFFHKCFSVIL